MSPILSVVSVLIISKVVKSKVIISIVIVPYIVQFATLISYNGSMHYYDLFCYSHNLQPQEP